MRRTILTTLVLLPVTALAHAATSNEPQPSSSSANVSAALKTPAAAASVSTTSATSLVHEFVQATMNGVLPSEPDSAGAIVFLFRNGEPTVTSAPSITHAVELGLTEDELAAQPAVTDVVVLATVDRYGFPRDLAISKSAGADIDRKVLAAVGQYRFKPATADNRAVGSSVTISVKIAKP